MEESNSTRPKPIEPTKEVRETRDPQQIFDDNISQYQTGSPREIRQEDLRIENLNARRPATDQD